MIKNFIIFILVVIIFALVYFILNGAFCSCQKVYCPSDKQSLKGFIA